MTDSRFTAANSFSLLTSSVSFVSLECISPPFPFIQSPTSFLKRLRLRCCRRQIRQIRRRRRLRRSLPHSSLRVPSPFPSAFQRCPQASPAETRASRLRPIRLRAGHRCEKIGSRSPRTTESSRARAKLPNLRCQLGRLDSLPPEADRSVSPPNRPPGTLPAAMRQSLLPCRSRLAGGMAPSHDPHHPPAHH